MPFYEKGDVRIHYQEAGSGFPLLVIPGGGLNSTVSHRHELLDPNAGRLLAENGKWVRDRLSRNDVPREAIDKHLSVIGFSQTIEAALAWYRALGERRPIGPTRAPTLFIWGETDDTVGRIAAEGRAEFIKADYHFASLLGVGHYAADQGPVQVNELLLDHLARHPG